MSVKVDGKDLEIVASAKLLGVTISSDLSWNKHRNKIIKKASKRLYFLVQLKRAKVPCEDLGLFYTTCIRSVLDYAVPVFYYSLPKYLIHELERIQKRALTIIYPSLSYNEALTCMDLVSLNDHHLNLCKDLFNCIVNDKSHRLHYLLPPLHKANKFNLRRTRTFDVPKIKTNRAKKSFMIASCLNFDTV